MPQEFRADTAAPEPDNEPVLAGDPVVIRRRAGVSALVGAAASAVAIAYLWRASVSMAPLDWALCLVMAAVAGYHLTSMVDSRTPLVVADDLGVRFRLGKEWRGLPWDALDRVVVEPRRGPFRDGKIVFAPHSLQRALEGVDGKARQHALLNQKMYGAALAVPLGVTTRIPGGGGRGVVDRLSDLALGRAQVIELPAHPRPASPSPGQPPAETPEDGPAASPAEPEVDEEADGGLSTLAAMLQDAGEVGEPEEPRTGDLDAHGSARDVPGEPSRRRRLGGIGMIVSRVAKGRRPDRRAAAACDAGSVGVAPPAPPDDETGPGRGTDPDGVPVIVAEGAVPLRVTRPALRAQVTREKPSTGAFRSGQDAGEAAEAGERLPEARVLRRPGSVDLVVEPAGQVRPIAVAGATVEPLVIDDFAPQPAADPVIGPELTAARTRLGLSVDELAERTRIRPHVIESIEVDDFAPCGGDFYARGHLRTLARVLGKDVEPLLAAYEERYATAPVNARRVFEAELATGMTGSMRSTVGGPSWGLLVGVVLTLVLVWGAVRVFASEPPALVPHHAPGLTGVTDTGDVAPGSAAQKRVGVRGEDRDVLGVPGRPGGRTFGGG